MIQARTVDTRVGRVVLREGGAGQPLVYLHSATGEGDGLGFLDALAASGHVLAPMFPGFGGSEGIESIDDMEDATFHLLDLWERLGLDAPVVVGLSLGGWMAAELATRHPERVGALVLVNPVGHHIPGAPIKDIFGRSPSEMVEDLFFAPDHPVAQLMRALGDYRSDPGQAGALTFDMIAPMVQVLGAAARLGWDPYLHNPKLRSRLWRISCPTLVVRGEADTLVPTEHARVYVEGIAGARLEVVPQSAHLVPLEQPERLAALVRDFVAAAAAAPVRS
ncbi:MAG: alpha/beta hydrolase [Actinobacteria bacterium]|nr:alpha/beta hydrolase [Actinomycetota bacterium]